MALSNTAKYYIPAPSRWPIVGAVALLLMALGATLWFNGVSPGRWVLLIGFLILLSMIWGWFGTVINESEGGQYNQRVDVSFRWGMGWFIFSEVMFFGAFFGALAFARIFAVPDLGGIEAKLLWPDYSATWPTPGPGAHEQFTPMNAWGIPALNTMLLLTSGATLTWAHYGLKDDNRKQLIFGLLLTVLLGFTFLGFQIYEYAHAYSELNLKMTSGIYGSTFYLLTGFHGFHVTVGAIILTVVLIRSIKGHFRPEHHFAFEAAAWYWHFVDVVWLGLFIVVYWL